MQGTPLEKLKPGEPVHLVGIGGAAQSALADVLLDLGYMVSGSDLKLSAVTEKLARRGAIVHEGHSAENLNNAGLVVTTVAAKADNIELMAAQQRGIAVLTVAEVVGPICNTRKCLAIAGTHGKTTTTNMVAAMLKGVGLDPMYFIGGVSQDLGRMGYAGKGEFAVIEADEYAGRFLHLTPDAAIITNIEHDHPDIYPDISLLIDAFKTFVDQCRAGAYILLCEDDRNASKLAHTLLDKSVFLPHLRATYGLSKSATWQALNVEVNNRGGHDFEVNLLSGVKVSLALPGLHNVRNALGALALCRMVASDISSQAFADVLSNLKGTSRRFEVKGEVNGILVVDDYAHHPTEVAVNLVAARTRYPDRRIVAVFQPHTYSRTQALLDEFAQAFKDADVVALLEIFAARETNVYNVSSADILAKMRHKGKINEVLTLSNAAKALESVLQPGDVLITFGAGDVWKVGEQVLEQRNTDKHRCTR
jgi:UDP-N-acetylmuramate--alanine ligase